MRRRDIEVVDGIKMAYYPVVEFFREYGLPAGLYRISAGSEKLSSKQSTTKGPLVFGIKGPQACESIIWE